MGIVVVMKIVVVVGVDVGLVGQTGHIVTVVVVVLMTDVVKQDVERTGVGFVVDWKWQMVN